MDKEIKFKTTINNSKKYEYKNHIWNLENQLNIDDILKMKEFSNFKHCATIIKSNKECGFQISLEDEFIGKPFIVYIITKSGKILKGGKSKNSLDSRSYSAGTEESWTMRGTPSTTNYVWSQIFRESLKENEPIKIYGVIVPCSEVTYNSFGIIKTKLVSHYEELEKDLNKLLKKLNGKNLIGEGKLLDEFKD